MIFEAQRADPTRERKQQFLRDCVDLAVLAENVGFSRVWAVEHHALLSAPEVFLAWVAAKADRIRVGQGVVCMPFAYNHAYSMRPGIRADECGALLGDFLSQRREQS